MNRRKMVQYFGLLSIPMAATSREAAPMWGAIAKIGVQPGKRDDVIRVLRESAAGMPGCLSYIVAEDAAAADLIWVTEVWDSAESHAASLELPAVKNAIPKARPLIASFERVATTAPVWSAATPAALR